MSNKNNMLDLSFIFLHFFFSSIFFLYIFSQILEEQNIPLGYADEVSSKSMKCYVKNTKSCVTVEQYVQDH